MAKQPESFAKVVDLAPIRGKLHQALLALDDLKFLQADRHKHVTYCRRELKAVLAIVDAHMDAKSHVEGEANEVEAADYTFLLERGGRDEDAARLLNCPHCQQRRMHTLCSKQTGSNGNYYWGNCWYECDVCYHQTNKWGFSERH